MLASKPYSVTLCRSSSLDPPLTEIFLIVTSALLSIGPRRGGTNLENTLDMDGDIDTVSLHHLRTYKKVLNARSLLKLQSFEFDSLLSI